MFSAIDLIELLYIHHARFRGLTALLPSDGPALALRTSLSYKNLVFRFEHDKSTYVECNYVFDEQNATLVSRYFQDPKIEKIVDQFIGGVVPQTGEYFILPWGYEPLSEKVKQYIAIAESIAGEAHYCASGDDYSPICFSKIIITDSGIQLEQINHMNSRSLAHKQDYSLRNLEFFISFDSKRSDKTYFQEEYIGTMRIQFSDSSSANNKNCGDKIRNRIDLERSKFIIPNT